MKLSKLDWSELRTALSPRLWRDPLCLIYQMPKVGSQTIEATLRELLPDHKIERFHFMTESGIKCFRRVADLPGVPDSLRENFYSQCRVGRELRVAVETRRVLRRFVPGIPRIKVITGVREPVGLMLSMMFQLHPLYFPHGDGMDGQTCARLLLGDASLDSTQQQAMASMRQFLHKWFDRELKRVFGVDVYQHPFPHEQGYVIFETKLARVLVHRFENIDSLRTALEKFLDRPVAQLLNRNLGEQKEYAAQYRLARRDLRLPFSFLEEEYDGKLARHFYTSEERKKWMAHWHGDEAAQGQTATAPAIWVDVGAHLGESSFRYAKEHPTTTVYAFEPNLKLAADQFNRLPNYIVLPMAVTETNGFSNFLLNGNTAVSSLLPFNAEGLRQWVGKEQILDSTKVLVPTIRLDTFMEMLRLERIDYLKIDAQGADFAVIRSAGEHLKRIQKIKLEVAVTPTQLYDGAASKKEIVEYLLSRGFALEAIEPQTHGQEENLTFVRTQP